MCVRYFQHHCGSALGVVHWLGSMPPEGEGLPVSRQHPTCPCTGPLWGVPGKAACLLSLPILLMELWCEGLEEREAGSSLCFQLLVHAHTHAVMHTYSQSHTVHMYTVTHVLKVTDINMYTATYIVTQTHPQLTNQEDFPSAKGPALLQHFPGKRWLCYEDIAICPPPSLAETFVCCHRECTRAMVCHRHPLSVSP